jgi:hypothetical protein
VFPSIWPTERLVFCPNACNIDWGCRGAKWADLDLLRAVSRPSPQSQYGDHCTADPGLGLQVTPTKTTLREEFTESMLGTRRSYITQANVSVYDRLLLVWS